MSEPKTERGQELLRLKEEILSHWDKLPPEHQATMLLVLLDRPEWADWVLEARKLVAQNEEDEG
jgi:hypothetical protein